MDSVRRGRQSPVLRAGEKQLRLHAAFAGVFVEDRQNGAVGVAALGGERFMTVVKLGDARVIPLPVGEKNGQGVIGNGIGRVLPRDLGKNFFRFPLPPAKPGPQSLPRALVRFRNRRRRLRFSENMNLKICV